MADKKGNGKGDAPAPNIKFIGKPVYADDDKTKITVPNEPLEKILDVERTVVLPDAETQKAKSGFYLDAPDAQIVVRFAPHLYKILTSKGVNK